MKKIILPIIILVAIIAGITIFSESENESIVDEVREEIQEAMQGEKMESNDSMMSDDDAMDSDDAMMEDNDHMESDDDSMMMKDDAMDLPAGEAGSDDAMMSDDAAMAGPGSLVAYEDVAINTLEGNIVLDFHASWCPTCRTLKTDLDNSLSEIPSDLTIVVVDYDTSSDLKQKYGVTRQHTLVQIDNSGNKITMWSGGNTLESIISRIQ